MAKYRTHDLRGHLDQWRQITFILFDLGAMNLLAGVGVTVFYSDPLALLGFTSRSFWLGLFFVLGGLLTWKARRLPAIVPLVIIVGDYGTPSQSCQPSTVPATSFSFKRRLCCRWYSF